MNKLEQKINTYKIMIRTLREEREVINAKIELLGEVIYGLESLIKEEEDNE